MSRCESWRVDRSRSIIRQQQDDGTKGRELKRAIDLTVGTVLAVASLPFIVVGAAISTFSLRCWPFFQQERLGLHGQPFSMWKIRTLPPCTSPYALKDDSVSSLAPTRATAWLRRTRLDELPQLFHVLSGELSLVGPRPKMPDEYEPVEAVYGAVRVSVPQGCTGLWQISAHTDALPRDHPEFDLLYVEVHSLRLDLWILRRTVGVLLGSPRRIVLDDLPRWATRSQVSLPPYLRASTDLAPAGTLVPGTEPAVHGPDRPDGSQADDIGPTTALA
jgi:lipopolysaccharide/colanic/teichoic acid biosynthesis glycosyltransferase